MRLKHGISFTVSGLSVYEGINPKNGIIKKVGDKMKNISIIITITMMLFMIFSENVLAAKATKEIISDDDRIINQFSVVGVKLGMGKNAAAIKLKKFAKELNGVLFAGCVSKNKLAYVCVKLTDDKISRISFHAAFLKIPYGVYGMDKEAAKEIIEKKYKITLNEDYSYEGDKLDISFSNFDIIFALKNETADDEQEY